jgi:alpha-tubulin suppressor-like RCC1 family protein
VTQVAAGGLHSLVLTSTDQLYAFGANSSGQLGSPVNNGMPAANPTPARVSLPGETGHVTQIAAGNYDSFAVTSTGQLYAFGDNQYGQLGNATHNVANAANPTPALVVLPGATGGVVRVAAGGAHTLALTSTGQLYAFGINHDGELGNATNNGNANANPTPAPVTLPGATGTVAQIAAGAAHSLALTSTGQLYAFGYNYYGQLGNTVNNTPATGANPTPALVSLPGATGAITQISAGGQHSLALTSTGQLYAFGYNFEGQLGTAINLGTSVANPTPLIVSLPAAAGPVIRIAAGSFNSLALTSTGQLYGFGDNDYGQLGTSTFLVASTLPDLPAGTTIDAIGGGPESSHTLAIVADLALTSGSLASGQVGVPYSASVAASGGAGPDTWAAAGLPGGLAVDASSGQITGVPTAAANASVVLTVTDADGISASATLPLTIAAAAGAATTTTTTTAKTVTAAQVRASLLAQLLPKGRAARIAALLEAHAYKTSFRALRAGSLALDWYVLPKGARLTGTKIKPVLVAHGGKTFKAAGTLTVTVALTAKGRRLLARTGHLRITAKGSFIPRGAAPVTVIRAGSLSR